MQFAMRAGNKKGGQAALVVSLFRVPYFGQLTGR